MFTGVPVPSNAVIEPPATDSAINWLWSTPNTVPLAGNACRVVRPKFAGGEASGDSDVVGRVCGLDLDIAGSDNPRIGRIDAGEPLQRGIQTGEREDLATAGAERDRLRRIGADRDLQRLASGNRRLCQQIGRRERLIAGRETEAAQRRRYRWRRS